MKNQYPEIKKEDLPAAAFFTRLHGKFFLALRSFVIRVVTGSEKSHGFWIIWDDEAGKPVAASQDEYFKIRPLEDYFVDGGYVAAFKFKDLSPEQRQRLIEAINEDLNKPRTKTAYDFPALGGQLLAGLTGIEWFKNIQLPWFYFCTEIMETHLRKISIKVTKFIKNRPVECRHPNPDDLCSFCFREEKIFDILFQWISR